MAGRSDATILAPPHDFEALGRHLREGHLVAFPTETVYGLGANGLNKEAVLKIFEAKGRPLTDPCILHVAGAGDALPLLDLDALPDGRPLFEELTRTFWPGPLSIVAPARPTVPDEVTAATGFVAVRCPQHVVARQLVAAAGVPLAAPSANRFGHISPTRPEHVFEDLQHVPFLRILDGGPCSVGIESTVVKLDTTCSVPCLRLLRRGGVTEERLEEFLKTSRGRFRAPIQLVARSVVADEAEPQAAPGMLLKHYAPAVATALLSEGEATRCVAPVGRCVLVDFKGLQRERHGSFLKVFELCEDVPGRATEAAEEACRHVFATLRAAEAFALASKAELICISDFDPKGMGGYAEALHDRLFRSASGQKVSLKAEQVWALES